MKSLVSVAIFGAFLVLVGCAGSVERVPGGSSGSSGSGGSSGSSGSSGSGDPGDVIEGSCKVHELAGNRACVPNRAKANAPITLRMETEGCVACSGETSLPCEVSVSGSTITLGASVQRCELKRPPDGCAAICQVPQFECTIPALAAGTYRVRLKGEVSNSEAAPRTLLVAEAGQASSCTFPPTGTLPPIEADDYATSCVTA